MKSFSDTVYEKDNLDNYFVFFVEDCQFFIKGNIISKMIKSLNRIGLKNNHISLCIWSSYRFNKFNNRIKNKKINKKFSFFKLLKLKVISFQ